MNSWTIIVPVIVLVIMIVGGIMQRNHEKKQWNGGICSRCESTWNQFDTDSQGGRMYNCSGGHYCDCSYNVGDQK